MAAIAGSGRIFRWGEAARFAELLQLLVERGLPLHHSLRLAAESSGDGRLRAAALMLAKRVHAGHSAHSRSPRVSISPGPEFPTFIRLALENAGDRQLLRAGLKQAAAMYHDRAARAADWYAEYLPILLTVAIGGTVTIGFTLFVIWPYASMLHELSHWNWR
jgi:type II secretory pathway component PulF